MVSPIPVHTQRASFYLHADYNDSPLGEAMSRSKSLSSEPARPVVDGALIEQLADNQVRGYLQLALSSNRYEENDETLRREPKRTTAGITRSKFANHHRQSPTALAKRTRKLRPSTVEMDAQSRNLSPLPLNPRSKSRRTDIPSHNRAFEIHSEVSSAQPPLSLSSIVQAWQIWSQDLPGTAPTVSPAPVITATLESPPQLESSVPVNEAPALSECTICSEEFAVFDVSTDGINHNHTSQTCNECLSSWIGSQLEMNGWERIRCPACPILLSHSDIQRHASQEIFQRYDSLATRATLDAIPNFRWCLGPICNSGQIHETGVNGPIMRCFGCGFRTCVHHEREWHHGETCQQYDSRIEGSKKQEEEKKVTAASMQVIFDTTKRCPGKGCAWNIEKNNGCDHMTCMKCRFEFCWQCLAPYGPIRKKGNSAHFPTCKYHTNNLR